MLRVIHLLRVVAEASTATQIQQGECRVDSLYTNVDPLRTPIITAKQRNHRFFAQSGELLSGVFRKKNLFVSREVVGRRWDTGRIVSHGAARASARIRGRIEHSALQPLGLVSADYATTCESIAMVSAIATRSCGDCARNCSIFGIFAMASSSSLSEPFA